MDKSSPGSLCRPRTFKQQGWHIVVKVNIPATYIHEKNLPIDGLILSRLFNCVYCTLLTISQFKGLSLQFRNLSPSYCLSMQLCQTEKNSALLRRFPRRWAPTSNWRGQTRSYDAAIEYIRSFTVLLHIRPLPEIENRKPCKGSSGDCSCLVIPGLAVEVPEQ